MNKIKIFLFEDEWTWAEAITSVINKTDDIEVVGETGNALKGLEQLGRLKPDVILLDIWLENDYNGADAIEEILTLLPQSKIIIYTNDPDEKQLYTAIKAGASGYLLKKEVNDPEILTNSIRSVFNGEAYITPTIARNVLNVIRNQQKINGINLTEREKEIMQLIEEGKSNKDIADNLNITTRTVANHISNILYKMNAKNRTEAVKIARKLGLLN